MGTNIPEFLHTRKATDTLLVAIILLLGILSFGLGRLSVEPPGEQTVLLCGATVPSTLTPPEAQTQNTPVLQNQTEGAYVASKNGSVYHFPWCSGAQRIKDENKVWFGTKEEAQEAGYRPASNCKGL